MSVSKSSNESSIERSPDIKSSAMRIDEYEHTIAKSSARSNTSSPEKTKESYIPLNHIIEPIYKSLVKPRYERSVDEVRELVTYFKTIDYFKQKQLEI